MTRTVIGNKKLIGWGKRSHGVQGGVFWNWQSPKPVVLVQRDGRDGRADSGRGVAGGDAASGGGGPGFHSVGDSKDGKDKDDGGRVG